MDLRHVLAFALLSTGFHACGDETGTGPEQGPPEVLAPVSLSIDQSDGFIDRTVIPNTFDPGAERFNPGDGSSANRDSMVFEILVTNPGFVPLSGIRLTDVLAPHSDNVACAEILPIGPDGSTNPTSGSISGSDCSHDGLVWEIEILEGGTSASLLFRAEPLTRGIDVNRVHVVSDQTPSFMVEEPILVADRTEVLPELSLSLEDGIVDRRFAPAAFDSDRELFNVGDGGTAEPDSLIYEVTVTNSSIFDASGVTVIGQLGGEGVTCREIPVTAPDQGANPSQGILVGDACAAPAFTWEIGILEGGTSATLYFGAEAVKRGHHKSRITLSSDALPLAVIHEELTSVLD